jgi:hypothetical protein
MYPSASAACHHRVPASHQQDASPLVVNLLSHPRMRPMEDPTTKPPAAATLILANAPSR